MSTGQALGGVVGAAAGFIIGGPTGALYGAQIGMMAGGYLDPPKGPTMEGPRLSDMSVQTSTYGATIPRAYGTVATMGNVFWLEHNKLKEVAEDVESGGKGGGATATTETFTYFATFAVGLCEGPIQAINRIWIGPDLYYDAGATTIKGIIGSNKKAKGFKVYCGDDTQLPDSRMQADLGAANCPAYRGLAYIVFYDLPLAKYGNSLTAAPVKVELVQDVDLALPTYFDTIPVSLSANERICYSDEHGYQTAEALTGYTTGLTLGVDYFISQVVFRTFNLDGVLIRKETQSHKILLQGSSSLTFYKSLYISGAKSVSFAYRASGGAECTLAPGVASSMSGSSQDPETFRSYAAGYYWFYGPSENIRLTPSGETTYVISGPSPQSVVVVEDITTGRVYRRWTHRSNGNKYIEEFDPDTLAVIWQTLLGDTSSGWQTGFDVFSVYNGVATMCGGGKMRAFDVSGSAAVLLSVSSDSPTADDVYSYAPGFVVKNKLGTSGVWRATYKPTVNQVPLAAIIEAECVRTGLLELSDIDTTDLADSVTGYRVGSVGSIRAAIEPLRGAYPFDAVQSGYEIKFISRGGASVATIDGGEIVGEPSFKVVREMDSQLPNEIALKFLDKARNYDLNLVSWGRPGLAVNRREIDMPAVVSAEQAQQIVEKLGNLYWLERNTFGPFSLPQTFAHLEPADVVTVNMDYATYELRLTSVNYKSDGSVECLAAENNAAVYISTAVTDEAPDTGEVTYPSATIGVVLDIPTINQTIQASPGVVVAAAGSDAEWAGCVVLQSVDGGQDWATVRGLKAPTTLGFCESVLSASDCTVITSEALTVRLLDGALSSITVDQMLANRNIAAYGNAGRWEIIRFATATLQAGGEYVLTDLVRGDFGTEWATGLHVDGDYFVLLDDADASALNISQVLVGSPIEFAFVTSGDTFSSEDKTAITWRGVSSKCLSPIDVRTTSVSTTITAAWVRRSRFASSWWIVGQAAPVAEESERYEVDILSAGVAVRTIETLTPDFTYTTAQQTTDFGSTVSSVDIVVYQMSAVTGRGYGTAATIYAA